METNETNAISLNSGDTKTIRVTVKDQDKVAFPLAGYTCTFQIRSERGNTPSTVLVEKVASPSDITINVVLFKLDSDDTIDLQGNYWYKVIVSDDTISDAEIFETVAQGRVYIHL